MLKYIPRTQMTLVLVGKVLVWGDGTSQIEVIGAPGEYIQGLPHGTMGNPCSMDHPMKTSHDLFGIGLPGTRHYFRYIQFIYIYLYLYTYH